MPSSRAVTPCLPLGPTLIGSFPSQSPLSPLSHPENRGLELRIELPRPAQLGQVDR